MASQSGSLSPVSWPASLEEDTGSGRGHSGRKAVSQDVLGDGADRAGTGLRGQE